MSKAIAAFILTAIIGIIGLILGLFINFGGDLGVILSIATMGALIISTIERNHTK